MEQDFKEKKTDATENKEEEKKVTAAWGIDLDGTMNLFKRDISLSSEEHLLQEEKRLQEDKNSYPSKKSSTYHISIPDADVLKLAFKILSDHGVKIFVASQRNVWSAYMTSGDLWGGLYSEFIGAVEKILGKELKESTERVTKEFYSIFLDEYCNPEQKNEFLKPAPDMELNEGEREKLKNFILSGETDFSVIKEGMGIEKEKLTAFFDKAADSTQPNKNGKHLFISAGKKTFGSSPLENISLGLVDDNFQYEAGIEKNGMTFILADKKTVGWAIRLLEANRLKIKDIFDGVKTHSKDNQINYSFLKLYTSMIYKEQDGSLKSEVFKDNKNILHYVSENFHFSDEFEISKNSLMNELAKVIGDDIFKKTDLFTMGLMLKQKDVHGNKPFDYIRDENGDTLWHIAARETDSQKRNSIAEIILEFELNPNVINKDKETPLHLAAGHLSHGDEEQGSSFRGMIKTMLLWVGKEKYNFIVKEDKNRKTALTVASDERIRDLLGDKIKSSYASPIVQSEVVDVDFFKYVKENNITMIQSILENNPNLVNKIEDKTGMTAFLHAVSLGFLEMVKLVVEKNADVNVKDKQGFDAYYYALHSGKAGTMLKYLQAEINLQPQEYYPNEHRDSILHLCVKSNEDLSGIIDYFIKLDEHKIAVDTPNLYGETPLHYAVDRQNSWAIRVLLKNCASIESSNAKKISLLHVAAKKNMVVIAEKWSAAIAQAKANVNVSARGKNKSQADADLNKVKEWEGKVNAVDFSGNTPLHYAVEMCSLEMVKHLMKLSAGVVKYNAAGLTPLHLLAQNKNPPKALIEIAEILLDNVEDKKSFIDLPDRKTAKTALHYAYEADCFVMVTFLIKKGAEVNQEDMLGKMPIFYSSIELFSSNNTLLHLAAQTRNREMISSLLSKKLVRKSQNSFNFFKTVADDERSSLKWAIELAMYPPTDKKDKKVVKLELGSIPLVEEKFKKASMDTILTILRYAPSDIVLNLLQDKDFSELNNLSKRQLGCSLLCCKDDSGNTLLHYVASTVSVNKSLVDKIAEVDPEVLKVQNKDGNSPAHLAAKQEHEKLAIELAGKGKIENITNNDGKTVIDLLAEKNLHLVRR